MASRAPARPLRALIVEDERVVAAMLVNVLNHVGIDVVQAVTTKSDAMTLLMSGEAVDIALVDVNLDVAGGGIDVAKEAAAQGIYVVIITGNDRVPKNLAGHALLLKPFSVDHLEAVIADARRQLSVLPGRDG
jgi:two-component SAPR family response regulator